ncbi:alpha/beta fold hydrolase [Streptomyces sp. UNOB3_S3]|uniref:alpha/beta fold hydrolase n=1 Tax=Streptomyces sp. UNOB3_S3 TaxID=2871682 RepID=UPI001E53D5C0|nr:alpha/beta fold hydrolase [Streptomyces sp. UNOB3_S3]MCC3777621.1 alpha/beta fold hydrolase [Streptomyces sp. UNOB3_S3]
MGDHRTVEVGGVRLAYRVSGPEEAPPLVLLHGLGEGAADWDGVAPAFVRDWRVYAPDLRGHGLSDWPGAYSFELMRDDVLGFLDALDLERADVIGHSMGGIVAYLLAAAQPQRVARLVVEDAPAPVPREPTPRARPEGDLGFDWDVVEAIRGQIDRPEAAWLADLGRIAARTLVLGGGPLSHVSQHNVAELARRVPDGSFETIPVGHLIHATAPEAFVEAALRFLRG